MSLSDRLLRSRFRGCLVGSAVGDSLGAPVEFLSRADIIDRHGLGGVDGFAAWTNDVGVRMAAGSYTDDTQLTIATAQGLLDAFARGRSRGIWHPASHVWEHYLGWLESQAVARERRYPGATCLAALRGGVPGDLDEPLNESKGSGAVMRVAPVGLAFFTGRAFDQAAETAALTHGHPTAHLAAGFLAEVIARIVRGGSGSREWSALRGGGLAAAIAEAREMLIGYDEHDEVLQSVDTAVELYISGTDLDEAYPLLGEGWVAEEALGIALFSALSFPGDFVEGVLAAVNITGDSDTTGCLTGAILGAALGEHSVPQEWARGVENADGLVALADTLFDAVTAKTEE